MDVPEIKRCLWCDEELMQRDDEHRFNFYVRKYCSKSHAALHSNARHKPIKKKHISCFMAPLYT